MHHWAVHGFMWEGEMVVTTNSSNADLSSLTASLQEIKFTCSVRLGASNLVLAVMSLTWHHCYLLIPLEIRTFKNCL